MTDEVADGEPILRVIKAPEAVRHDVRAVFVSRSVRVIDKRVIESLEAVGVSIEEAEKRARDILEEARDEAEAIRERAREEGRAEGLGDVLEELARARREYDDIVQSAEDDMLEMAFRLARRIIGEAIELEPARVRQMVANVLGHARGKREIVVHVAPDDVGELEEGADVFSRQVDGVRVHFEADSSLERGSCVIQTESGRIDGRIETQLQTLQRALRGG